MNPITYDLRNQSGNSDAFYRDLHAFSKLVIKTISSDHKNTLHQYADYVTGDLGEDHRSYEEYAIEFLTLGMVWQRYMGAAYRSSPSLMLLLMALYRLRERYSTFKPLIDSGAWLADRSVSGAKYWHSRPRHRVFLGEISAAHRFSRCNG